MGFPIQASMSDWRTPGPTQATGPAQTTATSTSSRCTRLLPGGAERKVDVWLDDEGMMVIVQDGEQWASVKDDYDRVLTCVQLE